MSAGGWMMVLVAAVTLGSLGFLIFTLVRSIQVERRSDRSILQDFGLGIALMLLFFGTWVGHAISQWQRYTDEQGEHGQPVEVGDFISDFGTSTLENWQSEFLQLF